MLNGMPVGPTKEVLVEVFFIRSSELSVIANSLTSPSQAKAAYKPDGCMSKWKGLSAGFSKTRLFLHYKSVLRLGFYKFHLRHWVHEKTRSKNSS